MFFNLDNILPQKYPFRMVDSIESFEKDKGLVAKKNITGNEWIYQGYKGDTFPETLLIEAAAQSAIAFCVLNVRSTACGYPNKTVPNFFLGKTKVEFYEQARIGDQVRLCTGKYRMLEKNGFVEVEAFVGEKKIADVSIFYAIGM